MTVTVTVRRAGQDQRRGAHPLAQDAKLSITLEIEATSEDGFTEQQVRTVKENTSTLKFDSAEFE